MKSFTICALLAAGVSAVPMVAPHHAHHQHHQKRDVVWVTETDMNIVTDVITRTVYVDGDSTSTAAAEVNTNNAYHHHTHSSSAAESSAPATYATTSSSFSSVYVASSSSSSSVYVAPTTTTTTTSAYVAPTTTTTTSAYVPPTTSATTSAYVAPTTTTTTSAYVAPTTTPAAYTTTTTTTSAAAPPTTSAPSYGGSEYVGALSYYEVGGGYGSCGEIHSDDEMVVALDEDMMDKAVDCGRSIAITANGATMTATIVDTCPGCRGTAGLDLSPSLFTAFAPTASGIVSSATWAFL